MAFSDARNERDRAAGDKSGRSSGGGGDRARAAEARNRAAMGGGLSRPGQVGRGGSGFATRAQNNPVQDTAFGSGARNAPFAGMGGLNPRRTQNISPSYEMSLRNVMGAIGMAPTSPLGVAATLGGIAGIPGLAPNFTGYRGQVYGPGDYDSPNLAGAIGGPLGPLSGQSPQWRGALAPQQTPQQTPQPASGSAWAPPQYGPAQDPWASQWPGFQNNQFSNGLLSGKGWGSWG